jgi:hypothetical protein
MKTATSLGRTPGFKPQVQYPVILVSESCKRNDHTVALEHAVKEALLKFGKRRLTDILKEMVESVT